MEITKSIFREYDIRGEYPNQINEEVVRKIGNAIAGKCINLNISPKINVIFNLFKKLN